MYWHFEGKCCTEIVLWKFSYFSNMGDHKKLWIIIIRYTFTMTNFTPVYATMFTNFIYAEWWKTIVKHKSLWRRTDNRLQALSICRCSKCYCTKNLSMTSTYTTADRTGTKKNILFHIFTYAWLSTTNNKKHKMYFTCVSPRENNADPCNTDIHPASQYKGLTSSSCLPSTLFPSAIILSRTT